MNKVIISLVAGIFLVLPAVTLASGTYYADTAASTASDSNACTSAAEPCASINGALGKITASSSPANATLKINGTFNETVLLTNPDLAGLTITWLNHGTRPQIYATGNDYGIYISDVNNVTIQHLAINAFTVVGIYGLSSSSTPITGPTIKDNVVKQDTAVSAENQYGISLLTTTGATISDNTVNGIGALANDSATDLTANGISVYSSSDTRITNNIIKNISPAHQLITSSATVNTESYALVLSNTSNQTVTNNTISTVSAANTGNVVGDVMTSFAVGIYMTNVTTATIKNNTISDLHATVTSTTDGVSGSALSYGFFLDSTDNINLLNNTVSQSTAVTSLQNSATDGNNNTYVYGLLALTSNPNLTVNNNLFKTSTAQLIGAAGEVQSWGITAEAGSAITVQNNRLKKITARNDGTGVAVNTGLYFDAAPGANVLNNRIVNLTAYSNTAPSFIGVSVGNDSGIDLLNNLIYFTTRPTNLTATGVYVRDNTVTDLRIMHNTLAKVTACFEFPYLGSAQVYNNLCQMNKSNAASMIVDSSHYTLTDAIASNNNLFFNTAGKSRIYDTGIASWLSLAEWKAVTGLDRRSVVANPRFTRVGSSKPKYLHLRPTSPAINAGSPSANFDSDTTMNTALNQDVDGDQRPTGAKPDIGADEFVPKE